MGSHGGVQDATCSRCMQIQGLLRDLSDEIASGQYTDTIGRSVGTDSSGAEFARVVSGGLTELSTCEPRSGLSLTEMQPVSEIGEEEDEGVIAGASARHALLDDSPALRLSNEADATESATATPRGARSARAAGAAAAAAAACNSYTAAAPSHASSAKPNRHQPQAAIASVAAKLAAALQPLQARGAALSRPHRSAVYELLSSTCDSAADRSSLQMHGDLSGHSGFESSTMNAAEASPTGAAARGAAGVSPTAPVPLAAPRLHVGQSTARSALQRRLPHDDATPDAAAGTAPDAHAPARASAQHAQRRVESAPAATAAQQHRIPRRKMLQQLMQQEAAPQLRHPPHRQDMYLHGPFGVVRSASARGAAAADAAAAAVAATPSAAEAVSSESAAPRGPRHAVPQRSFLRHPQHLPERSSSAALSEASSQADYTPPSQPQPVHWVAAPESQLQARGTVTVGAAGAASPPPLRWEGSGLSQDSTRDSHDHGASAALCDSSTSHSHHIHITVTLQSRYSHITSTSHRRPRYICSIFTSTSAVSSHLHSQLIHIYICVCWWHGQVLTAIPHSPAPVCPQRTRMAARLGADQLHSGAPARARLCPASQAVGVHATTPVSVCAWRGRLTWTCSHVGVWGQAPRWRTAS